MKPELRLNQDLLNAMLPDLAPEAEAELKARIRRLARQEEEKPMNKKLSVGLALALVMTLLALGALAAVLIGGKDFVESILAPKAVLTQDDKWSQEELDELMRIAKENGLPITDQLKRAFEHPEGSYKQELIHAVLRDALGFYYSTWSVEDQAWYENLLIKTGLKDFTWATLPQAGDISLEQARETAARYIADTWGEEKDLMNPVIYRHHQQFQNYQEGEHLQTRRWYLEFEALDLHHDTFRLTIRQDGKVEEAERRPGVGKPYASAYDVFERYEYIAGSMETWPPETWVSFQRELKRAVDAHGDGGMSSAKLYLSQDYLLPTKDMISKETACEKALASPGAPEASRVERKSAVLMMDGNTPVWKVALDAAIHEPVRRLLPYLVEINALNGEIRSVHEPSPTAFRGYHPFILNRFVPAPEATPSPGPTRRPDGKPSFWYSDAAPDYYWKALDEYGYTKGDTGELIESWYGEFGADKLFWPLEAQALIALWHEIDSLTGTFPGLPSPEDIQREQAIRIADEALRQDQSLGLMEKDLKGLVHAVSFNFDSIGKGSRTWFIQYLNVEDGAKDLLACVVIDAKTGEVVEITDGQKSHS